MLNIYHFSGPNADKQITKKILCCWAIPLLLLMPSLSGIWGQHGLECNSRICTIIADENQNNPKMVLKLLAVALPITIMIAADISIFVKMRVSKFLF